MMKNVHRVLCVLLVVLSLYVQGSPVAAQTTGEREIRTLLNRFEVAAKAKDVNRLMALYLPGKSLVVFDFVPPRQYVGAQAMRKDWVDFFATISGPFAYDIIDLSITAQDGMAFSHRIDEWTISGKNGAKQRLFLRVTDVYRKIGEKWLIVHEHVSVPVDPDTGKAIFVSR